jgi:hypothetical protein
MEQGQLSRDAFMRDIAAMTERTVQGQRVRPRQYSGRLRHAAHTLPQLRGRGQENYRRE